MSVIGGEMENGKRKTGRRVFDFLARVMGLRCEGRYTRISLEQRLRFAPCNRRVFLVFPVFPNLFTLSYLVRRDGKVRTA